MKRLPLRPWLATIVLLLLPTALYWSTIFHRYGFRDDYSVLRESREEPGKIVQVCAMQARPIYGVLLESSFGRLRTIDGLAGLRLLSALLLGVAAATLFWILRRQKWERALALLLATLVVVLPGAQLFVAWTVAWPLAIALWLALVAFACAENAFEENSCATRIVFWALAVLLVMASALIYQPNSLFYLVPVAAGLWPRRRRIERNVVEWFVRHGATVVLGLAGAFTVTMVGFAREWMPVSNRVALEHDGLGKFFWFLAEPLQNALALILINDDGGSPAVHRAAALVMLVLIAGVIGEWRTRGARHGLWWALALCALLVGSFGVNLFVADRWAAYRVLLPLSGVIAVFLAMALLTLGGRRWARAGFAALVVGGVWLARSQAFDLIAWPQSIELALLEKAAARIAPAERPSVFVITPTPDERVAPRVFHDEFGSLSTDSDWVPKEMLKDIMRERFPATPAIATSYAFACGRKLPPEESFDVIVDLRVLRGFRGAPVGARSPAATVEAVGSR
ncbi:MAG TPA: hypothetical protein VHD62_10510 [Opitutaceae bacterium]|nr:hypothetical protein [Opitutaceae bacterium]